mgnify:CR=1 FL=1|tara:strand:- start:304 stop:1362 length:1059 start_codon:yes stop_codon:yes gene_type:complete
MNNQVLFVSVLLLSVSVAILFYQNVKLSRKLDQELGTVNKNMTDMSRMIALNNNINLAGGEHPNIMDAPPVGEVLEGAVNLEPKVTEEFKQEINQLKTDYQDYELSNELKNEIDNLERMENLPESMELSRENLEELQNAQMEEIRQLETAELQAVAELEAVAVATDVVEELVTGAEEAVGDAGTGEMVIETLETGEEDLEETNLDNQIVDWNDEVELQGEQELDRETIQEVSLDSVDDNLNPPESISLDSSDIKAEVTQGVNELVGNIIASASDVEVIQEENVIKLSNDGDSVSVTLNNEARALEDLNGNELKEVCKYFNLKGKGKKIELIERIKDYQINLKNSKNFFVLGN